MQIISLIVAMDRNGVIGAGGKLPWRLSADLKRFKAITMGKPIVMGRRTHESIGRSLPGRENIVVTRDRNFRAPGCTVVHSMDAALDHCRGAEEVIVMGGAELYREALPLAERIYLTEVSTAVMGDTFFPDWKRGEWKEVSRQTFPAGEDNEYPYSFVFLERVTGGRHGK